MNNEIDKLFTSERAKQYVAGLKEVVDQHEGGLITDQHLINTVVLKSLQMLLCVGVVDLEED